MWTRSSGWVAVALLCKMLVPALKISDFNFSSVTRF